MIRLGETNTLGSLEKGYQRSITQGKFVIIDRQDMARPVAYHIPVITRLGPGEESSVQQEEDVPMDSPPLASRNRSRVPPQGHRCLPSRDAARGGADWRVLLCLDINQILTRQNLLRPLPAGEPGRHRLRHQAFLVSRSLPGHFLGRGVP
jgi:hypothetical protein